MSLLKSRFIEMFIEKRYPTASLDELSICGGEYGAQSSAIEYHPNRPRYVRITDINEDGSLNNDYASSANIKDDEQYRLKYGDFLFARMGATVGKTYAYTFGDQIYAGYLIRYRLNLEKILPEYLFAFTRLNCYWKWVSINQNGAAQPGINAKKYGSLYVPVPPIEEQKKFIELSQQIDKSKFLLQQILKKLELLKKSRFIELFGSTDLSLQKDDWVEIKNIGEVVSGSTPKTTNESYWGGENKWITPAELSSNTYVITKTDRYLTDEGVKSCSLRKLPKDTVLLTSRAPIGKVAIAGTEMYCNQGFKNIICNEKIRPKYLFYLLKNNVRYLEYLGRGATFKEISKSIVENVKIPLFPLQDQDRFIEFAEQIDKSKLIIQKALEDLVGKV